MESRIKLMGHSVHQQLVVFPLGLLATAVIFDLLRWFSGNSQWTVVSLYLIGAGTLAGVVAALFGWIDWLKIPKGTRAYNVGTMHGIGNALVLLLFAGSFALRRDVPENPPTLALICSYAGGALAVFTGWLGGELVARLGVGVDDAANLNAPSSLRQPRHLRTPNPHFP